MPSSTFFRLPEEKRLRLTQVAWETFGSARLSDVSINQIIQKAGIPRGSFYQYFADKEDLFYYLLRGAQEYFLGVLTQTLQENGGNIFDASVQVFDRFLEKNSGSEQYASNFVQVIKANQGLDIRQVLIDRIPEQFWEEMDLRLFRRPERSFLEQAFSLVMLCTATAIIEVLTHPEAREHERELLRDRIEILAYGSLKPDFALSSQGGKTC